MRGNGKRQFDIHTTGISLNRCIDKLTTLRKFYYFIHFSVDFLSFHPRMAPFM
jgi:hypothetical protein